MRVLQVNNVGRVVGGTGACGWSVTRALPDCEHVMWFRSQPTAETVAAFVGCKIEQGRRLERADFERIEPDVVVLHNTPAEGVFWGTGLPPWRCWTLYYQHSVVRRRAGADRRVVCSEWLRDRLEEPELGVLIQGVGLPGAGERKSRRGLSDRLVIGRICTPTERKWGMGQIELYGWLADRFPKIEWEFVGCPAKLQERLRTAVRGAARFFSAGWGARSRLHEWHGLLYSQPDVPETFGRVCAEALRCGCVPLVDRQGGFIEQLSGTAGFLCENREQFSAGLQEISGWENWAARSRSCREAGEERFSHAAFRGRIFKGLRVEG